LHGVNLPLRQTERQVFSPSVGEANSLGLNFDDLFIFAATREQTERLWKLSHPVRNPWRDAKAKTHAATDRNPLGTPAILRKAEPDLASANALPIPMRKNPIARQNRVFTTPPGRINVTVDRVDSPNLGLP